MGKFAKAVRRNHELIRSFFGNLDDIKVTISFRELMKDFKEIEMRHFNKNRYLELSKRVNDIEIEDEEEPVIEERVFDRTVNLSDLVSYQDYLSSRKEGENYLGWIEMNKELYPEEYERIYTTEKREVTPLEYIQHKAGFTEDDIQFWKWYKEEHLPERSRQLRERFSERSPSLISRGDMKDKLYRTAETMVEETEKREREERRTAEREKVAERPKTRIIGGHKVTYTDQGEHTVEEIPELRSRTTQDAILRKIGYRITLEKGEDGEDRYYFERPTDEGWERTIEATEEQYKAYQTTLQEKGKSQREKLEEREDVRNQSSPKRRRRRR